MNKILKSAGRLALYILALVGFVFIGGMLVFYSLGYRYDFGSQKPYKIGILNITTAPAGANVSLDGKLQNKKTPVDFRNLLPKQYAIKIEKDGYQTFAATAVVQAGLVTRLENIFLVAKTLEPKKLLKETASAFLSDNRQRFAFILPTGENAGIWLYDSGSGTQTKLFPLQKSLTSQSTEAAKYALVSWSKSGKTLLIKVEGEPASFYALNADNPSDVRKFSIAQPLKTIWKNEEPLFLLPNQNLVSQTGEVVESLPDVMDATFFGDQFYLIKKTEGKVVLEKRAGLAERAEELLQLPLDSNYSFYPETDQMIMLRKKTGELAWLKTEGAPQLVPIAASVNLAAYNGKTLIAWDGLEINAYNFPFDEKKLLVKLPDTTLVHLLFFDGQSLLTQENGQILLRSLHNGQGFPLVLAPEAAIFSIRDQTLYYGSQGQIWSLLLQPK